MPVAAAAVALGLTAGSAFAGGTLRVAMTASDVPTTTGAPDNGYEGLRFLGYPVFEGLVLWDLNSADKLAGIRPGLAEQLGDIKAALLQVLLQELVHRQRQHLAGAAGRDHNLGLDRLVRAIACLLQQ